MRSSAAYVLGDIGKDQPEAITALLSLLQDDNPGVRSSAAGALGKIGKDQPDMIALIEKWLEQHQHKEYVGNGIDVLWNLVADDG